jgi:hypothetical protein
VSKQQRAVTDHKLIEVTLTATHTHAGKRCAAGSKIKVNEAQRDWLIAHGRIKTTTPKEASDT